MEKLKKDHFKLLKDENGFEYLVQAKDELTKNHRTLEKFEQRAYMPENRDDPLCPIISYKKYMDKLNPMNEYLWQTPLQRIEDEEKARFWYSRAHLGKNPLSKFMTDLSIKCELSMIYKNHSIRATGCTVTGRLYNAKVTMAWSGHKSVQSLTGYQKVSHAEKMEVGKNLTKSLQKKEPMKAIEENPNPPKALPSTSSAPALPPNQSQIPPPTENDKALVPAEVNNEWNDDDFDFDLYQIVTDLEKQSQQKQVANVSNNNTVQNKNAPKSQMFSGCKIGVINLQIHNHYK